MFSDKLNEYLDLIKCSGKALSEYSGISEATISRYKTGERIPKPDSGEMQKLCRGLCQAAEDKNIDINYETVLDALCAPSGEISFDYSAFREKINMLFSILDLNAAEMSKALKYDSSYISRIRSGKRTPAKPEKFIFDTAEYITAHCSSVNEKRIISELTGVPLFDIEKREGCINALANWIMNSQSINKVDNPMKKFIEKLNEFNLNEYIRSIHFDELKIPSVPFQLPTSKSYFGLEEMKNGEIDFLKATALSRSKKEVLMCSDMQMDDMAKDLEFTKKYMFGLAAMLKKGLHLNVVHNLTRPFNELMIGLEGWIPLYMTGQISPYYLKGTHNQIFCHFLNVSGSAALSGECISGHHSDGKYYLTKNKNELQYYANRAAAILQKAQPLMEIYRENSADALNAFLLADAQTKGNRKNILSAPPLYALPKEALIDFLNNHSLSSEEKQAITTYAEKQKALIFDMLKNGEITDILHILSENEFKKYPVSLPLSNIFFEKDIVYSYEEYIAHLEHVKEFAKNTNGYSVLFAEENVWRNISIAIHENEWAMISKSKSPAIHFVIRHPILRDAIEKLDGSFI